MAGSWVVHRQKPCPCSLVLLLTDQERYTVCYYIQYQIFHHIGKGILGICSVHTVHSC